ncbi:hypothetical protein, partial [Mesorhizobium sp.]
TKAQISVHAEAILAHMPTWGRSAFINDFANHQPCKKDAAREAANLPPRGTLVGRCPAGTEGGAKDRYRALLFWSAAFFGLGNGMDPGSAPRRSGRESHIFSDLSRKHFRHASV